MESLYEGHMEELYEEYAQMVYRFLLSACHDPDLAEDLTQETFFQAIRSLERFRGECRLSTWFCQIAKHVWYQYLEKHGRELAAEPDPALPGEEDTERQALVRVELADVLDVLETLPPLVRRTVYLRTMEGLSYQEIGEILGKSENWARVTYFRAKQKLIEEVGHDET